MNDIGVEKVLTEIDQYLDNDSKLKRLKEYRAKWQRKRRFNLKQPPQVDHPTMMGNLDWPTSDVTFHRDDIVAGENSTIDDVDIACAPNYSDCECSEVPPAVVVPCPNNYECFDEVDLIAVERIHEIEQMLEFRVEGNPADDEPMHDDFEPLETLDKVFNENDVATTACDSPGSLWADLRDVANQTNMTTVQVDAILKCLKCHPECVTAILPKSYKTFLRTSTEPIKNKIRKVSGHDYHYLGLSDQICFYLDKYPKEMVEAVNVLEIIWNNDGLPLYNSRNVHSWPVLCYIANLKPRVVFEVVVTAGPGKPKDTDYLEEFVTELGHLMKDGINFSGKHYAVLHKAGVCDAPARAQVKNTKQYSAKVGCDMCDALGVHDGKRVVWVGAGRGTLRTNTTFRQKEQPQYHLDNGRESPFTKIDVDMVKEFPPDFMHQGGGTVKKMLLWLVKGPKLSANGKYNVRLTARNILLLDERIKYVAHCIPNLFNCKLRTTVELSDYKYTELRQFLLYTGKLLLMGITSSHEIYIHFLTYSIACCLMVDNEKAVAYHGVHSMLMNEVVSGFSEFYAVAFMTYNVHVQQQLPEVAAMYGGLDVVSAYPFENHLAAIKRSVTSSHNALVSIIKGIERRKANMFGRKLRQPDMQLYVNEPNNIYVNHTTHKIYQAIHENKDQVKLKEYMRVQPFFEDPVSSYVIGCYLLKNESFKYVYYPKEAVLQLRRGFKVDLDNFPGLSEPRLNGRAVCFTMLHNSSNSIY